MTTLDAGITEEPPMRGRFAFISLALAPVSVAAFVATSLALKAAAHLVLTTVGLVEDQYGQYAEFVLTAALSMFIVRKVLDLTGAKYDGRIIFGSFAALSVLVMTFALSSGLMRVDFLVSLLQMSAFCLFAYLQFWRRDGLS